MKSLKLYFLALFCSGLLPFSLCAGPIEVSLTGTFESSQTFDARIGKYIEIPEFNFSYRFLLSEQPLWIQKEHNGNTGFNRHFYSFLDQELTLNSKRQNFSGYRGDVFTQASENFVDWQYLGLKLIHGATPVYVTPEIPMLDLYMMYTGEFFEVDETPDWRLLFDPKTVNQFRLGLVIPSMWGLKPGEELNFNAYLYQSSTLPQISVRELAEGVTKLSELPTNVVSTPTTLMLLLTFFAGLWWRRR